MHEESADDAVAHGGEPWIPAQADKQAGSTFDAKAASQELMELAQVERVICVDDWYAEKEDTGEAVLAALADGALFPADLEAIADVIPEVALLRDPSTPAELLVDEVRGVWASLDENKRKKIHHVVDSRLGPDGVGAPGEEDEPAAACLRELLAESSEFLTLSLSDWRRKRSSLLTDGKSTLILFDRDFSREGASQTAGEEQISLLLRDAPDTWRIGLLTHTVSEDDAEIETWKTLSRKFEADSSRFLVIAKGRLSVSADGFPRMLKLTLLAPALERLQDSLAEAVNGTWVEAIRKVGGIDPYTLEAALNGDRLTDGTWGPETLLRIATAFTQDSVRAKLRADRTVHLSSKLVTSLSQVKLPSTVNPDRVRQELSGIERLEYFETADHLTGLHFPLEVGDIFAFQKFVDKPHQFERQRSQNARGPRASVGGGEPDLRRLGSEHFMILLSQPCDLAVRSDGKRGNGLEFVRVAPLKTPTDRMITHPGGEGSTSFDLPFFYADSGLGVEVKLSQQHYVPLTALDMCVLSDTGQGLMSANQAMPDHVLPNWQKRFEDLRAWVAKQVDAYKAMEPQSMQGRAADQITAALTGTVASPKLESLISLSRSTVVYGVSRVGRLREPYRSALLSRMAQRDSRDAFDPSLIDKANV
ncbi:hypothetical protein [Streptomyces rubrogriseus]|uniref:hypothetical protein n=1 Tax=Streptomyces rubrogriseus TaxID=194673 RepID=UPI00131F4478|nr:hypothetical protein [Streptomyces rubrogriseus]